MPCGSSVWSSTGDKGSNTHSRRVPAPPSAPPLALPLEHPRQLSQSQALSTLLGAAANCSLCPTLFMRQGSQEQQAELPSIEQGTGHSKKGKGWQCAHPVRCRYASLNSVLAEKLQLQHFGQLGTPGSRKGWSLPRAEAESTGELTRSSPALATGNNTVLQTQLGYCCPEGLWRDRVRLW